MHLHVHKILILKHSFCLLAPQIYKNSPRFLTFSSPFQFSSDIFNFIFFLLITPHFKQFFFPNTLSISFEYPREPQCILVKLISIISCPVPPTSWASLPVSIIIPFSPFVLYEIFFLLFQWKFSEKENVNHLIVDSIGNNWFFVLRANIILSIAFIFIKETFCMIVYHKKCELHDQLFIITIHGQYLSHSYFYRFHSLNSGAFTGRRRPWPWTSFSAFLPSHLHQTARHARHSALQREE